MELQGPMAIQQILEEVEAQFKIPIINPHRHLKINFVRQAACVALRHAFKLEDIGNVIGRHHSTLCHYTKSHEMNMTIDLYRKVYKFTLKLIKNMPNDVGYLIKERDILLDRLEYLNEMILRNENKNLQPELVSQ